jgi:peptidoglycan/LPS O-acetylase OafA/YrhL
MSPPGAGRPTASPVGLEDGSRIRGRTSLEAADNGMARLRSVARQPALDGLRGAAIAAVVAYHYFMPLLPPGRLNNVATMFARSGVDLFFVLSGYLLGGILLDNRRSPSYFRTFYARRACRILPLYVIVLAVAGFIALTGLDHTNPVLRETLPWWSYVTFTQNVVRATHAQYGSMFTAATWSLAVEEQFYLILPLTIWLISARWVWLVASATLLVSPLLRLWTVNSTIADPYTGAYVLTHCRLDTLFAGVLIAWLVRERRAWIGGAWLTIVIGVSAGIVAFVVWADLPITAYVVILYSGLAVCCAALLARVVTAPGSRIARLFAWLPLRWAGIHAYGIYLLHVAVVHALHWVVFGLPMLTGHGWRDVAVSLLAVAATGLLAQLSWRRLEMPWIEWSRRRWPYEPPDKRGVTMAFTG